MATRLDISVTTRFFRAERIPGFRTAFESYTGPDSFSWFDWANNSLSSHSMATGFTTFYSSPLHNMATKFVISFTTRFFRTKRISPFRADFEPCSVPWPSAKWLVKAVSVGP